MPRFAKEIHHFKHAKFVTRFDFRPYRGLGRCYEEMRLFFGRGPLANDLIGELAGDFLQVVELPNERADA